MTHIAMTRAGEKTAIWTYMVTMVTRVIDKMRIDGYEEEYCWFQRCARVVRVMRFSQ